MYLLPIAKSFLYYTKIYDQFTISIICSFVIFFYESAAFLKMGGHWLSNMHENILNRQILIF
ncbi:hypothetical protein CWO92_04565 [Heyndrickxia camelliae]|uniref:Uncharacterized protein n=1 Tax=Heyndrickxia camelliae TaxID=1707093 RepID=A0A2N3LPD0_9BACI|nr:hypothetical protein CWO92_04565 [Heyndrickxia camelliae]